MKLAFSYPRRGLEGQFATFRLGVRTAERFVLGTEVEVVATRTEKLLTRAVVTEVYVGVLTDMAMQHAHMAHNWKSHPTLERPALLIASMKKRYPPNRVFDHSLVSVIYLNERTP